MTHCLIAAIVVAAGASAPSRAARPAPDKVPIVAVTGCLAEQGTTLVLISATDPVPSVANAPPAGQPSPARRRASAGSG